MLVAAAVVVVEADVDAVAHGPVLKNIELMKITPLLLVSQGQSPEHLTGQVGLADGSKSRNLSVLQGLRNGEVGVVVRRDLQDVHRLLAVRLRQLVDDVQQLLQLGLKHLQIEKMTKMSFWGSNVTPQERPPSLLDPCWKSPGCLNYYFEFGHLSALITAKQSKKHLPPI